MNVNQLFSKKQKLPNKENSEQTIKLVTKNNELQSNKTKKLLSEKLRSAFWEMYIPVFNTKSDLYKNITFTNRIDHWLDTGASIESRVGHNFLICKDYCGVELNIDTPSKEFNEKIYVRLYAHKEEIEGKLEGFDFAWEKQENNNRSRIGIQNEELSLFDQESWDEIYKYSKEVMIKLEAAIKFLSQKLNGLRNNGLY